MSLIAAHQISPTMKLMLQEARRVKMAKAELALIRIQSLLGLSDAELICAAKRVAALDDVETYAIPPKRP
ncbi:hypothetical protein AB3X26_17340 [Raoultella planticola]|uniref:hypothetical protein n=1 Tax=Raoultella planticola TaxID=575 RepID=UPI00349F226D